MARTLPTFSNWFERVAMPKKAGTDKRTTKAVVVESEQELARGRYANHIQVAVQREEFILDFLARVDEKVVHVGRFFITPDHAERLATLLKRQVTLYKKTFPASTRRKASKMAPRARRS